MQFLVFVEITVLLWINLVTSYKFFPSLWSKTLLISTRREDNALTSLKAIENNHGNEESLKIFNGPIGSYDTIEKGFDLQELGISLMVGESTVCNGRGLFISLANDTLKESIIPIGTILCGYSKGEFKKSVKGDKTVGCYISDLEAAVIFNKQLYSLAEVVETVTQSNLSAITQSQLDEKTSKILLGHRLYFNQSKLDIALDIADYPNRFFVPFSVDQTEDLSILNIGMFANDLAFKQDWSEINETSYKENSKKKNFVQLIWRLEEREGKIVPTWPVVLFIQDTVIRNHEPMEVGLEYGWSYWEGKRQQELKKQSRFFSRRKKNTL